MSDGLSALLAAIDEANGLDPNTLVVDGVAEPKELAHSRMVTEWVRRFDDDPSDEQLIAARAHHLRRWSVPRTAYPEGRAGYLRWRKELGERHRAEVAEMMAEAGYGEAEVVTVTGIMAKRDLATDPAVQVHEDALCMVFLQTQLDDLVARLGAAKAADVVTKTLRKMSTDGIAAAQEVEYSAAGTEVVGLALDKFAGEV